MRKGWINDSERHRMARYGVTTSQHNKIVRQDKKVIDLAHEWSSAMFWDKRWKEGWKFGTPKSEVIVISPTGVKIYLKNEAKWVLQNSKQPKPTKHYIDFYFTFGKK